MLPLHFRFYWRFFRITERPVVQLPVVSRPPLYHFFSLRYLFLPYVSLSHELALCLPTYFTISGLVKLGKKQDFPDPFPELLLPLTRSCLLILFFGRFSLFAFPPPFFTVESIFSSRYSRSDPLFSPSYGSRSPLLSHLTICSFWQRQLWCPCQLLTLWH